MQQLGDREHIGRLMANAAHCRKLAAAASDPEVREALLEIAGDIEVAIPFVEGEARRQEGE